MMLKKQMTARLASVVTAGLLCLPGSSSATVVAQDVQYGYIHGYIQFYNAKISSASSGTIAQNVLTGADAGASVTLSADWRIVDDGGSYCTGCMIQAYAAWINPAAGNGASPLNLGLISFNDIEHGNAPGVWNSGHFDWTVTAPTVAGDYYIGAASTLDFGFQPWVTGGYGYLPADAASFQVSVGEVPEPASLALAGLGLVGLAAARRRKA